MAATINLCQWLKAHHWGNDLRCKECGVWYADSTASIVTITIRVIDKTRQPRPPDLKLGA